VSERKPVAVYTDVEDTDPSLGVAALEDAGFEVRILRTRDADEIISGSQDAEVLLIGYADISRRVIEALPKLKLISLMSMGFNNVDLEAATERGVWVTNVPGAATEEVATHSLALLLFHMRQLRFYLGSANPTNWNDRAETPPARLSQLTLGVVGLGKIGRKFAEVARPLFGNTLGYDPLLPDNAETKKQLADIGVTRTSLDELTQQSNVVSLHLPLTDETAQMVDKNFVNSLPQGAVIVNPSRGQLLDVAAVSEALDSGQLGGAVLDVLDQEPPSADHPLLGRDNVVITPHIAYFSKQTEEDYVRIQAENAVEWFKTGEPATPLNRV
jgi:phosphoglycerate dehydrogenase-like enzyme